jgi:hypothetical protein
MLGGEGTTLRKGARRQGTKRGWSARLVGAAVLLASAACVGLGWEEVDFCPESGCSTCASDGDCVVGASCCSEELYCSHRLDGPIVCQLGCSEPDAPACGCVEGRCRFE